MKLNIILQQYNCLQIIITMERMDYSNDRNDLSDEEDNKLKAKVSKVATWLFVVPLSLCKCVKFMCIPTSCLEIWCLMLGLVTLNVVNQEPGCLYGFTGADVVFVASGRLRGCP